MTAAGRVRLVLVRHGETDFNAQKRIQGQVDIALNQRGLEQARAIAAAIKEQNPLRFYTSPLTRAAETARILAAQCAIGADQVHLDERLIERGFGPFEGISAKQLAEDASAEAIAHRRGEAVAGVESRQAVGQRVAACLQEVALELQASHAQQIAAGKDVTAVFVLHGAAISIGITAMLGLDPETWAGIRGVDNCHWSVLVNGEKPPGWLLVAHNVQQ